MHRGECWRLALPSFSLFLLKSWKNSNSAYSGSDQTKPTSPHYTHTHTEPRGGPPTLSCPPTASRKQSVRPQLPLDQQECLATNPSNVFKMILTVIRKSPHLSSHLKFLLLFYNTEVCSESLGEKRKLAALSRLQRLNWRTSECRSAWAARLQARLSLSETQECEVLWFTSSFSNHTFSTCFVEKSQVWQRSSVTLTTLQGCFCWVSLSVLLSFCSSFLPLPQ